MFQHSLASVSAQPSGLLNTMQEYLANGLEVRIGHHNHDFANVANATSGNVTIVSVITATPEVSTMIATAITATIQATTASVSMSTTSGQSNSYLEAAVVIVVAAILGAVVFVRKKKIESAQT
jgi:hypothetical protein